MVDEQAPNENNESAPVPGPRRSTFTPVPSGQGSRPGAIDEDALDDDALAGALSQQFQRWAPPSGAVSTPASGAPVAAPLAEPHVDSVPTPPQRVSLTDDQLISAANLDASNHDTGALLDLVERELQLRQTETRRLAEWEQQVRATAGPEADELVLKVRSQFSGVGSGAPVPAQTPEQAQAQAQTQAPAPDVATSAASSVEPAGGPQAGPYEEPAVEPLVEPATPSAADPTVLTGPTSIEALLAAAAPTAAASVAPLGSAEQTPFSLASNEHGSDVDRLLAAEEFSTDTSTDTSTDSAVEGPIDIRASGDVEDTAAGVDADTNSAAVAITSGAVVSPRAGRVEVSGLEPTPAEQRAGRSIRLFWLWFAVNSSVVSIALGAVILGLGVSLRQAVLSALIGVALSFLPLGLGTLAGKWSGQPTMVVSRATFGMVGNVLPALLAVITRVAWAAALLWMLATGVAEVLLGASLVEGVGRVELTVAAGVLGLIIAAVIAGFGFGLIAVVGVVVSIASAVLVVGLIVLTAPYVDLAVALSVPDGEWVLMLSGAVLVFSVVGLAWANSSGDLARYQAKGTSGSSALLFTAFGATVPAFALISWGAVLAASNPTLGEGLQSNPIDLVSRMLPLWYPAPLIAGLALSLVAAAAVALYSGGFALLATGVRVPRAGGVVIAVVLTAAVTAVLLVLVADVSSLFRDVVTTLAVPVAAWAGIFGAETMIRTRRMHSASLVRSGGVYPAVRWVNVIMLVVITAVGWGLSTAAVTGLQWQGYLFGLVGVDISGALAESDPGVLVALGLGLLTPLIAGIPALKKLQVAERSAAEAEEPALVLRPSPIPPPSALESPQ